MDADGHALPSRSIVLDWLKKSRFLALVEEKTRQLKGEVQKRVTNVTVAVEGPMVVESTEPVSFDAIVAAVAEAGEYTVVEA